MGSWRSPVQKGCFSHFLSLLNMAKSKDLEKPKVLILNHLWRLQDAILIYVLSINIRNPRTLTGFVHHLIWRTVQYLFVRASLPSTSSNKIKTRNRVLSLEDDMHVAYQPLGLISNCYTISVTCTALKILSAHSLGCLLYYYITVLISRLF